jgi:hypothetical protein
MTLEDKLYTLLSGDAAVAAIVSSRIYPDEAPQGIADPYLTYQRIASGRDYTLGGYSNLENPIIQVDCWAADNETRNTLRDAVIAAMRASGTFQIGDDNPRHSKEDGMFRASVDFSVWNMET